MKIISSKPFLVLILISPVLIIFIVEQSPKLTLERKLWMLQPVFTYHTSNYWGFSLTWNFHQYSSYIHLSGNIRFLCLLFVIRQLGITLWMIMNKIVAHIALYLEFVKVLIMSSSLPWNWSSILKFYSAWYDLYCLDLSFIYLFLFPQKLRIEWMYLELTHL